MLTVDRYTCLVRAVRLHEYTLPNTQRAMSTEELLLVIPQSLSTISSILLNLEYPYCKSYFVPVDIPASIACREIRATITVHDINKPCSSQFLNRAKTRKDGDVCILPT